MTAPNLEQIIADHLPLHGEYRVGNVRCICGWEALVQVDPIADDLDQAKTETFAAHVVAAIRGSGYTVIALPRSRRRRSIHIRPILGEGGRL
ncbi:hypothetical protein SEA_PHORBESPHLOWER_56 [Gordonia phage PhorbesPhlower]|nr:hypothetical protein SEA_PHORBESPHLOWER_56 [Gordonia phage PhorbesPhlower]